MGYLRDEVRLEYPPGGPFQGMIQTRTPRPYRSNPAVQPRAKRLRALLAVAVLCAAWAVAALAATTPAATKTTTQPAVSKFERGAHRKILDATKTLALAKSVHATPSQDETGPHVTYGGNPGPPT